MQFVSSIDEIISDSEKYIFLGDEAFLPKNAFSVYEYYISLHDIEWIERPANIAFISLPSKYKVYRSIDGGRINDYTRDVGYFYATELYSDDVKYIDWYDANHKVYQRDNYNRYGFVYRKDCYYMENESTVSKYYSSEGVELLSFNKTNGTIALLEEGKISRIYESLNEFFDYIKSISAEG